MNKFTLPLIISFVFVHLLASLGEARRYQKIELPEPVSIHLNAVLGHTSGLHQALYERKSDQAQSLIRKLIQSIEKAQGQIDQTRYALHLKKVLQASHSLLVVAANHQGESQLNVLSQAFHQIVQLARTYKLESYSIFFCGKDRSVWIQSGSKPANPINPDMKCGVRVS